jgi:hypothetical protein
MADIDLKTLTPDTSLPTTGFLFGADSQATVSPSVYGVTTAITTILGNAASSDALVFNSDTTFSRGAIRNFRFGAADAATALAQTLSVQSVVAGTSNTAGAAFTINGSQGTGTGVGGSLIFQVAPAGTAGTLQNALVAALTIDSTKAATFAGAVSSSSVTVGNTILQSGYLQARTLFATSSGGVNQVALFPSVGGQAGVWVGAAYPIVFANVNDVNGATGDVFLTRVTTGVVKIAGTSGTGVGAIVTTPTVVGSLPSAATAGAGARAFVTDSNQSMTVGIGTAVVGGGANKVPVYSDGASWLIG